MSLKETATRWILNLLHSVGIPSLLPWSFRSVRKLYHGEPDRYFNLLRDQARHDHWLNRFFAGHELHTVYSRHSDDVIETLQTLSSDDKEIVREGAARSWSHLLEIDYETVFSIIKNMKVSEQFETRYTSALAPVRYYDDRATDEQQEEIISFWESFEDDPRKGLRNLVRSQILEEKI